jgi:hypothetical protein
LIAVINARRRRFDAALASYDRALALWLDPFPALTNRGVALHSSIAYHLRIGLVWSGSSSNEGDAIRSVSLRSLLPLADLDAEFVSWQKEIRGDDTAALKEGGGIVHFGDKLDTLADMAAVIANLDLVISVDRSVAHRAGALAKPVWVL